MATYNWSIRPGVKNKYGIVVADSADDVKPNGFAYYALFGNDETGNGSRMKPYATSAKAFASGSGDIHIFASGTYRVHTYSTSNDFSIASIVGDGDVIFDFFNYPLANLYTRQIYNVQIKNLLNLTFNNGSTIVDCLFNRVAQLGNQFTVVKNTIFSEIGNLTPVFANSNFSGCTFYRVNHICFVSPYNDNAVLNRLKNNIFVECNISSRDKFFEYNSLYYHCNFLLNPYVSPYVVLPMYPSVPEIYGPWLRSDDINELRDYNTGFSGNQPYYNFNGCKVIDPKFNNIEIGDFTLAFDSPAKNMSYFGTYIGACSIAYPINISAIEADGMLDFSTAVNVNITDNSVTMIDASLLASIETKIIPNLIQRELGKAPIQVINADRNGQYVDSIADLATTTISAGTDLKPNTPYIVEGAAIVYSGNAIQPGERFTTTTVLSFATAENGVCREITEAPQRHTLLAKFADTESDLATASWQHYEYGSKLTSNNVGDSRTGAIVRGNGDPAYERGDGKEFAINAKFMKVKYVIQPNNLRP